MPAGFRYPLSGRNLIYTPRLIDKPWMQNRGSHRKRPVARIKDGVTFQQAQADLQQRPVVPHLDPDACIVGRISAENYGAIPIVGTEGYFTILFRDALQTEYFRQEAGTYPRFAYGKTDVTDRRDQRRRMAVIHLMPPFSG
jgi:hypothetical protein